MRITETYDVVGVSTRRTFRCRVCGIRGSLQRTFRQTINPFNKNGRGQIKTRREIRDELRFQAAAWKPDPVHAKCAEGARP
jgi:hypothetical protein